MKKILAILITVLLCLTSTAYASVGWEAQPVITSPCTIGVKLYEYSPVSGIGGSYYPEFTGTVRSGMLVRFRVLVKVAEGTDLDKLTLKVEAKNLTISEPTYALTEGENIIEYIGLVEGTGAATVTATLSYAGLSIAELPRVTVQENGFQVDNLTFLCDTTGKITTLLYKGETLSRTLAGELDLTEAEYKDLQATLAYLGFSLDGGYGYLSVAAFEAALGGAWSIKATGIYQASTSITTPGNVAIPQTGEPSVWLTALMAFIVSILGRWLYDTIRRRARKHG